MNRLDEPVFIAVSKLLLTEFGIHLRLESCDRDQKLLAFLKHLVQVIKSKAPFFANASQTFHNLVHYSVLAFVSTLFSISCVVHYLVPERI